MNQLNGIGPSFNSLPQSTANLNSMSFKPPNFQNIPISYSQQHSSPPSNSNSNSNSTLPSLNQNSNSTGNSTNSSNNSPQPQLPTQNSSTKKTPRPGRPPKEKTSGNFFLHDIINWNFF